MGFLNKSVNINTLSEIKDTTTSNELKINSNGSIDANVINNTEVTITNIAEVDTHNTPTVLISSTPNINVVNTPKRSAIYLYKITNASSTTNEVQINFFWYEEDNA